MRLFLLVQGLAKGAIGLTKRTPPPTAAEISSDLTSFCNAMPVFQSSCVGVLANGNGEKLGAAALAGQTDSLSMCKAISEC